MSFCQFRQRSQLYVRQEGTPPEAVTDEERCLELLLSEHAFPRVRSYFTVCSKSLLIVAWLILVSCRHRASLPAGGHLGPATLEIVKVEEVTPQTIARGTLLTMRGEVSQMNVLTCTLLRFRPGHLVRIPHGVHFAVVK